jgi:hypothetical protein
MLPVQDYQPRIRLRLDDAVTVLKTIEHVDNQQPGNFFQRDMENIASAKVQKLEEAFTAQMQTLLATQQKTGQNLLPKRTAAQFEDAKGSKKRKNQTSSFRLLWRMRTGRSHMELRCLSASRL